MCAHPLNSLGSSRKLLIEKNIRDISTTLADLSSSVASLEQRANKLKQEQQVLSHPRDPASEEALWSEPFVSWLKASLPHIQQLARAKCPPGQSAAQSASRVDALLRNMQRYAVSASPTGVGAMLKQIRMATC